MYKIRSSFDRSLHRRSGMAPVAELDGNEAKRAKAKQGRVQRFIVYRMIGADGALLYVGKSRSVWTRMRDHDRDNKPWIDLVVHIIHEGFPTQAAMDEAETRIIFDEKPLYNEETRGERPRDFNQSNVSRLAADVYWDIRRDEAAERLRARHLALTPEQKLLELCWHTNTREND